MPKTLTTNTITNELKGSAWFRRPEEDSPTPLPKPESEPKPIPKPTVLIPENNTISVRSVQKVGTVNRTKGSSVQKVPTYKQFERTNSSSVQQPNTTRTIRRAYDLYNNQLIGLRRVRATRELSRDSNVSFSEMVREAVDLLLEKEGIK